MADKSKDKSKQSTADSNGERDVIFVKEFVHWRSKKVIRAADYGKVAFPIPRRGRK